jgi:hypothetical protein
MKEMRVLIERNAKSTDMGTLGRRTDPIAGVSQGTAGRSMFGLLAAATPLSSHSDKEFNAYQLYQ